jgi:hypothetical protein
MLYHIAFWVVFAAAQAQHVAFMPLFGWVFAVIVFSRSVGALAAEAHLDAFFFFAL